MKSDRRLAANGLWVEKAEQISLLGAKGGHARLHII
jgi:hypothetical protein